MRNLILAGLAAFALAVPAAAQRFDDPALDREIAEAIPSPGEMAVLGQAMDGVLGAFLDMDVRPFLDAADPYRRNHYRGERTLRDIGRRDDPYFEERLRRSIHNTTAGMGAMLEALAAAAPAMRRSLDELERNMAEAMRGIERD